ncbi:MAG: hypothetical protein ACRBCT_09780 [Alphaproteobacteria bacterium]
MALDFGAELEEIKVNDGKFAFSGTAADFLREMAIRSGNAGGHSGTEATDNSKNPRYAQTKKAQKAAETRAILDATNGTYNFTGFINNNWTPEAEAAQQNFLQILLNPNGTREQELDAALNLFEEMNKIANKDPEFMAMSPEEREFYLRNTFEEKLIETLEKAGVKDPQAEADAIFTDISNDPERAARYVQIQLETISSTKLAKNAAFSISHAIELTEAEKDTLVISLDYGYNGSNTFLEVYAGTAITADGKGVINDGVNDLQYYTINPDGTFSPFPLEYAISSSPGHEAELANQIKQSGFEFNDFSDETRQYLAAEFNVTSLEQIYTALQESENNYLKWAIMPDENFIQIVGSYALPTRIQEQQAQGQVFANDQGLQDLLSTDREAIIEAQHEAIQALKNRVSDLNELAQNPIYAAVFNYQINDLNDQITAMETQLAEYQAAIASVAAAQQAKEEAAKALNTEAELQAELNPDFVDPVHLDGGFGRNGVPSMVMTDAMRLAELEEGFIAKADARDAAAERLEEAREALADTADAVDADTDALTPKPSDVAAFLTDNKMAIADVLKSLEITSPNSPISEAELRMVLEDMPGYHAGLATAAVSLIAKDNSLPAIALEDNTPSPLNTQFAAAVTTPEPTPQPEAAPKPDTPAPAITMGAAMGV